MNFFYLFRNNLTTKPPEISVSSRSFLFGESVFTTFLLIQGKVFNVEGHKERIDRGASFFWNEARNFWDLSCEELQDHRTILSKGIYRVRLTLFERDAEVAWFWTFGELSSCFLNQRLPEAQKIEIVQWQESRPETLFKVGDYARIFKIKKDREKEADDLLKGSAEGALFEFSTSNLVILKGNEIMTPPIGPNVLPGTQMTLLQRFPGKTFLSKNLTRADLFASDFIFGSNAIKGLFVISHVDQKPLTYSETRLESFWNDYKNLVTRLLEPLC